MLKHTFVSAKTDGADPTIVQPSNWNAEHVVDGDGLNMVADASVPTPPAAGYITLFGKLLAGGVLPAYVGPAGLDSALQPFFGRNKVGIWATMGGTATTPTVLGMAAIITTGTLTARTVATTNFFTAAIRSGYISAATAGASAGPRSDKAQYWRGNAAGLGGFRVVMRFGCSDAATVADARSFVGLASTISALTNTNPSANTNIIGVGTDSGESTLSIMHNDGSGTATKVALGANFPDHTLSMDMYELVLFAAPNASEVGWQVTRLNTGDVATGTITTDLPASTTLLAPQIWRNNGTTALAVGVDLVGGYFERDY